MKIQGRHTTTDNKPRFTGSVYINNGIIIFRVDDTENLDFWVEATLTVDELKIGETDLKELVDSLWENKRSSYQPGNIVFDAVYNIL